MDNVDVEPRTAKIPGSLTTRGLLSTLGLGWTALYGGFFVWLLVFAERGRISDMLQGGLVTWIVVALPAGLIAGLLAIRHERALLGRRSWSRWLWGIVGMGMFTVLHWLAFFASLLVSGPLLFMLGTRMRGNFETFLLYLPVWMVVLGMGGVTLALVRYLETRTVPEGGSERLLKALPRPSSAVLLAGFYLAAISAPCVAWMATISRIDGSAVGMLVVWCLAGVAMVGLAGLSASRFRGQLSGVRRFSGLTPEREVAISRLECLGHLFTVHWVLPFLMALFLNRGDLRYGLLALSFVAILVGVAVGSIGSRDRYLEASAA